MIRKYKKKNLAMDNKATIENALDEIEAGGTIKNDNN